MLTDPHPEEAGEEAGRMLARLADLLYAGRPLSEEREFFVCAAEGIVEAAHFRGDYLEEYGLFKAAMAMHLPGPLDWATKTALERDLRYAQAACEDAGRSAARDAAVDHMIDCARDMAAGLA